MTQAERSAIEAILAPLDFPTIVELGAYTGEDSAAFRALCRKGDFMHVMVEPDPRNAQKILDCADPPIGKNRRLIVGAVAETEGFRKFHFSEGAGATGSGSLLRPTGHLREFPTIKFDDAGMVPCYSLDEIFKREWLSKIDLLWVDIQGAEKEMIAGGRKALQMTRTCFIEAESIELYEGQALKPELVSMFGEAWKVTADFGFNVLLRNMDFVPPWGN